MSNFLIKNNEIIIKFLGLICIFFILDIINDYHYTNIILKFLDDKLIHLGIKKKKIKEGFAFGAPFSAPSLPINIMTAAMMISAGIFISLFSKWVIKLGMSIGEAIYGSLMTAIFGSFEIAQGIPHLIVFSIYLIRWFVDHIICGLKMMFSLPTCIIFYIFNLIGQLIYLPFRAMWFLLWLCGFEQIYDYEKKFWDKVWELDIWVFKAMIPIFGDGIHFAAWPKSIRQKCFSCVRLKMGAVGNKFMPVGDRFGKKLPKAVKPYIKTAGKGFMGIIDSFTKFP